MRIVARSTSTSPTRRRSSSRRESERERLGTILHVAAQAVGDCNTLLSPVPAAQLQRRARRPRRRAASFVADAADRGGRRPRRRPTRATRSSPATTRATPTLGVAAGQGRHAGGQALADLPQARPLGRRGGAGAAAPATPKARPMSDADQAAEQAPPASPTPPDAAADPGGGQPHPSRHRPRRRGRRRPRGGDRRRGRGRASTGWCRSAATWRAPASPPRVVDEHPAAARRRGAAPQRGAQAWPTRGRARRGAAPRSSGSPAHPRVRVIGETGLDYFRTGPGGVAAQQDSFRWHIDLAKRTGKALQIHDRDAHEDVLRILRRGGRARTHGAALLLGRHRDGPRRASTAATTSPSPGTVTFKNAQGLRDALAVTPLEQVLVETDAPYLTPSPHRGADQRAVPRAAHRPGDGRRPQRRRAHASAPPSRPTRSASTAPGDPGDAAVHDPPRVKRAQMSFDARTMRHVRYQNLTFRRGSAWWSAVGRGLDVLGRHAREAGTPSGCRAPFPCVGAPSRGACLRRRSAVDARDVHLEHRDLTSRCAASPKAPSSPPSSPAPLGAAALEQVRDPVGGRRVLLRRRLRQHRRRRPRQAGHHPRPARRRRPLAVRADRRRRQGRRPPRPAAHGHRRRQEEATTGPPPRRCLGAVRDGHPRRHRQAVGVALADPRPRTASRSPSPPPRPSRSTWTAQTRHARSTAPTVKAAAGRAEGHRRRARTGSARP